MTCEHVSFHLTLDPVCYKLSPDLTDGQRAELAVEAQFYGLLDRVMPYYVQEGGGGGGGGGGRGAGGGAGSAGGDGGGEEQMGGVTIDEDVEKRREAVGRVQAHFNAKPQVRPQAAR